MSKVYFLESDGLTSAMTQIKCKDEEKELQLLLEKNHDLLPGDQINPDEPRRWLLVKREMPVPDPGTGEDRWSIDFLFVDQGGMPTFVECKRFGDTRSRREVVGQMLDYAANGHHYWTRDIVRDLLIEQSVHRKSTLDELIRKFEPETADDVDAFFEVVENNLREGQIRLIFFLEEAPYELRSIAEFLNKQMERTEVLIVEAKQYEKDGLKIVVPRLFGYTEQARRVKKTVTVTPGERRKWNEGNFFDDVNNRLSASDSEAIRKLYNYVRSKNYEIRWGTGKHSGSFIVIVPKLFSKSIFSVGSDGLVWLNFASLSGDDKIERFRNDFAEAIRNEIGIPLPDNWTERYFSVGINDLASRVEEFIKLFGELVDRYTENDV